MAMVILIVCVDLSGDQGDEWGGLVYIVIHIVFKEIKHLVLVTVI